MSEAPAQDPSSAVDGAAARQRETGLAARNALKLGLSLLATLVVTISVRFWLPRLLGPELYGQVAWAESTAILAFLVATLGIDTYIAKEFATDARGVEPFLGGLFVLRALLGVVAIVGMLVAVVVLEKPESMMGVAVAFGLYELFRISAETIGGVMNTSGRIDGVALARPATKLAWGVIVLVGMLVHPTPLTVALAFMVGELLRFVVFTRIMARTLGVRFVVDLRRAFTVVAGSMGYFINTVIHQVYGRVDVQMISTMAGDRETGFHGAASNVALAGLLFLPVVHSVVLPMAARIAAADHGSMSAVMRQGMRLVLVAGTFPSLMLVLHRELVVELVFGEVYLPTALTLGTLGFLFPLTYAAVITSLHLIQLGKIWVVTRISLIGLVLNPTLNFFLIPYGLETFGAGGAGFGAGFATVVTETCIVLAGLFALGKDGVDRTLLSSVLKLVVATGATLVVHDATAALSHLRIVIDTVVFVAVAFATGALPRSLPRLALDLVRRRRGAAPAHPSTEESP